MANGICVFCGQKPGTFRSTTVTCGNTLQTACKACEKHLRDLDEEELCRRALMRGFAEKPELLRERIALLAEAEDHRPRCLRCGSNLVFLPEQELDNDPMRDTLFAEPFEVQPAYCEACGRYEFFNPAVVRKNKHLVYLIFKDTRE